MLATLLPNLPEPREKIGLGTRITLCSTLTRSPLPVFPTVPRT